MSLNTIIVVNTAPGCDNYIEQQVSATTCNTYIVRITPNTNALGPFDVYVSTYPDPLSAATLYYSAQTRTQMLNGVVVQLGPCITPTPTPTPSITPTPGVTPTQTQTPSETPTNTPTPSITPSASETPTPTPSFTSTPTQTPTFTPSETPTETPTPTPTVTSTQTPTQTTTPTPTSTPTVFDILILDQEGNQLITQDGNPLILQEGSTPYLVSSGDSTCICGAYTLTQTIYSPTNQWPNVLRFYSDAQLNNPLNGGSQYYSNTTDTSGGMWQIGVDGFVIGYLCNPC